MVRIPFPKRDENLALAQEMVFYNWLYQVSTPAGSRSQPAPPTRALPTQDVVPDDLG
jgi:hypothetical protein